MRWRDVLIGAFITLFVTVTGGIVVWYLTKQPPPPPPTEKLVYESERSGRFVSEATRLSFNQVRVANIGSAAAHNVMIAIQYSTKAKIVKYAVSFSSGPAAGEYSLKRHDKHSVAYQVQTLAPAEIATVATIVEGQDTEIPSVAVKSDKTTGVQGSLVSPPSSDRDKKRFPPGVPELLVWIIALPIGLLAARIIHRFTGGPRTVNNVAFMYIHKGMHMEALPMLQMYIREKGANGYELANYGLCLGLEGEYEKAEKNFEAAEFYEPTTPIKALVAFSRGILSYCRGDVANAKIGFERALQLSKRRTKRYAGFSDLMARIFKENEDIRNLFVDRS